MWTRILLDEVAPSWRTDLPTSLTVGLVDLAALRGTAPYIAHEDMMALWAHYTDGHADDIFGLHFVERHADRALGMYAYAAAHAPDFGTAARTCIQLQRLLDTQGGVGMDVGADHVIIHHAPLAGITRWPRHLAESLAGGCVHLGRRFTGVHVTPREVHFQHPDAGADAAHWFGCPVRYNQPRNALVFDAATFALPFRHADPTQFAAIVAAASRTVEQLAPPASFLDEVRAALRARKGERPSLAAIARAMRTSARTLQRRLAEEGATFRQLLDEVRVAQLAEEDVASQKRQATAGALGFADPSSLRRLWRRSRRSR